MLAAKISGFLHLCIHQVVPLSPDRAAQMHPHRMPSFAVLPMLAHFVVADMLVYAG